MLTKEITIGMKARVLIGENEFSKIGTGRAIRPVDR